MIPEIWPDKKPGLFHPLWNYYILVSVIQTNRIEHVSTEKSSDSKCREVPAHYCRAQFHHVLHAAGDF